jgi:hypothetical protein
MICLLLEIATSAMISDGAGNEKAVRGREHFQTGAPRSKDLGACAGDNPSLGLRNFNDLAGMRQERRNDCAPSHRDRGYDTGVKH